MVREVYAVFQVSDSLTNASASSATSTIPLVPLLGLIWGVTAVLLIVGAVLTWTDQRDHWVWHCLWWTPLRVAKYHRSPWIVLMASAIWVGLSAGASFWILDVVGASATAVHSYLTSPGVIFALFVAVATLWGTANTLIIYYRQQTEFTTFESFGKELADVVAGLDRRRKFRDLCLIIDYSPRIGDVSRAHTALPNKVEDTLRKLRLYDHCESHLLIYTKEELERWYKARLRYGHLRGADLTCKLTEKLELVEKAVAELDFEAAAVWRSDTIPAQHYVVTSQAALEYVVTPRPNGSRNEILGRVTEDPGRILYLHWAAENCLRQAVTPYVDGDRPGLIFRCAQSRIKECCVYVCEDVHHLDLEKLRDREAEWKSREAEWGGSHFSIRPPGGELSAGEPHLPANGVAMPKFKYGRVCLQKDRGPQLWSHVFEDPAVE